MPALPAPTRSRMRDHLTRLAERHAISVTWIGNWKHAESFPAAREAVIPKIRKGSDYLVALHEFGHIVSPVAYDLRDATGTHDHVLCEGAAWAWAAFAADPALLATLGPRDWDRVNRSLASHIHWISTTKA